MFQAESAIRSSAVLAPRACDNTPCLLAIPQEERCARRRPHSTAADKSALIPSITVSPAMCKKRQSAKSRGDEWRGNGGDSGARFKVVEAVDR